MVSAHAAAACVPVFEPVKQGGNAKTKKTQEAPGSQAADEQHNNRVVMVSAYNDRACVTGKAVIVPVHVRSHIFQQRMQVGIIFLSAAVNDMLSSVSGGFALSLIKLFEIR